MTNTPAFALSRDSSEALADQIVRSVAARIDERLLRPGARMPSIRQFAATHGVSPFTVVASYDRLVAQGYLDSRRGAGFFVRERAQPAERPATAAPAGASTLDVAWLIRNMFRQSPLQLSPGAGVLPADWMDGPAVANALKSLSRQNSAGLLGYGAPHGFLPLRQQLQRKLAELEIEAPPEHIVMTLGVTQALDLVAREFCRPGDTVLVDDPAWFLMFGSFAAMGLNVVGVRRLADGPDLEQLAELAALHRPCLYVINSVLHNPTSTSISAPKAFQVLRLAEQFGFTVVEDDIYADLHPGSATRLAALDGLRQVIYLGGFSKSMAPNLRVGFIAASGERARRLADRKMLATLTTSDIGERVVYKILSEGHYRKHLDRVRSRLDAVRPGALRQLELLGLRADPAPSAGMFIWVDAGRDTNELAARAMREDLLLAPGSLFSPNQLPSTRMRLNVAALQDPATSGFLERALIG
ncbi:aminotransferase-like domain-containing protein [Massilia yuzhufengensis]|uniref:DNA-binding transcriptional regulator, MocR family, contains an aminotransferase domain n=1 Tax=Massilia yuzhufengensis TaxID=1164594 RepID=A0A1I1SMH4_9BURK|nr:PLP-dependent aminotransferase family protein [Massilia yuzhufengensis]SFD45888.1 DNA-binding transcriptional regulator, MocR family, contains an aminotransferase domain [Massilia yuzhufengensis]